MAAQLEDRVLDLGLNVLDAEATGIYICAAEPDTYAKATTTALLGYKTWAAGSAVGSPSAGSPGRQVTTTNITDGTITTAGTAAWWAICDTVSSRLLAHQSLAATQVVAAGNTFTLAPFNIKMLNS